MKKFWLCLGIALILACWSGKGYYGFGTCPAFGQPYYDGNLTCDPSDPNCYNDYYAAPTANPLSQLLYYVAPPVVEVQPGYGPAMGRAQATSAKSPAEGTKAGVGEAMVRAKKASIGNNKE